MKGDFSRIRFNPSRHYTSVLQQQGRVSLDADANEQCLIDEYIRRLENDDIIGKYGAPIHDAGFGITLDANGLQIGAGRYYVNGILCQNEAQLDYEQQPYLANPESLTSLIDQLQAGKFSSIQVFLEVWQRMVTWLDDSCLREPALGQADTTTRIQTVWRVVAEGMRPKQRSPIEPGGETSTAAIGTSQLTPCCRDMYAAIAERTNLGAMAAQTTGQTSECTCQPTPAAGYRGLENQLYRVEIHQGGDETTATFKWSRENASVVAAVHSVSGSDVVVGTLGPDANLGFQAGQWVEISDDTMQFAVAPNQSGDLYQIVATTPEQLKITVDQTVAAVDTTRNARLRRWEQTGATATADGVPLAAGTWLDLENGIQVQFAAGQYQAGDHWLIPARTASGQIDWPPCGGDGSDFQPPQYIHVHRAPLACIHAGVANRRLKPLVVDDCRIFFSPLTELAARQVPPALHVKAINWLNDDFLTMDQLVVNGLKVTLDADFTGRIDASTFVVSVEIPVSRNLFAGNTLIERAVVFGGVGLLRSPYIVDGGIAVSGSDILWQLTQRGTVALLDQLLLSSATVGEFARARVKLTGRAIFSGSGDNQLFLDGQSYGTDALRSDGKTPRIDLQLPSGNQEKASDFESWFFLAPALAISSIAMQPAAVRLVRSRTGIIVVDASHKNNPATPVTPTGTITLNYPPLTDTVVNLSVVSGSGIQGILSVPNSITIKAGETTGEFQIHVGNPGGSTQHYQISALIDLAGNLTATAFAAFSVTGIEMIRPPILNLLQELAPQAETPAPPAHPPQRQPGKRQPRKPKQGG